MSVRLHCTYCAGSVKCVVISIFCVQVFVGVRCRWPEITVQGTAINSAREPARAVTAVAISVGTGRAKIIVSNTLARNIPTTRYTNKSEYYLTVFSYNKLRLGTCSFETMCM